MLKRVLQGVLLAVTLFCLVLSVSLVRALLKDDGLSVLGRGAAWARNHNLGGLVDAVESWRYSDPPSTAPADDLPVASVMPQTTVVNIAQSYYRPDAITTPVPGALPQEGQWSIARTINGKPIIWTTGLRPSAKFPSVTASYALIDQSGVKARLYNGTEVPGGNDWQYGNKVSAVDALRLVFAFNGGFRKEHASGGYYTEGQMRWPLVQGAATITIDKNGLMNVGIWGEEPTFNDDNVSAFASIRQNLRPTVIDGKPNPELRTGYWGGGKKGEIYILRSGLCKRYDDKLMFIIAAPTDASTLAASMVNAGCKTGMQLDQNDSYPRGYIYNGSTITELDERMAGKTDSYLTGSLREFFAFFE